MVAFRCPNTFAAEDRSAQKAVVGGQAWRCSMLTPERSIPLHCTPTAFVRLSPLQSYPGSAETPAKSAIAVPISSGLSS